MNAALTIRPEQNDALSAVAFERFLDKMSKHLETTYPEKVATIPRTDLLQLVRDGVDRARDFGVVYEYDVQSFLDCLVDMGPGFESIEQVAAVLNDRGIDGTEKMDRIEQFRLFLTACSV